MKGDKTEIRLMYERFLKAHADAHPLVQRQNQLRNAQKLWNSVKNDQEKYDQTMRDLKVKASQQKSKSFESWANLFKKPRETNSTTTSAATPSTSAAATPSTSAAATPTSSVATTPTSVAAEAVPTSSASTSKASNENDKDSGNKQGIR